MSAQNIPKTGSGPVSRARVVYLAAAVVTVIAGLASRRYRDHLPDFLAEYAGDTLWALLLFLLVSTLLTDWPVMRRAALSLGLASLVELSQLYHAPWIDAIRQTMLGGLVLGFGFLWTDLVCYSVGIILGAASEWALTRHLRTDSKTGSGPVS